MEATVAAAIVAIVALIINPSAPGAGAMHPHLMWIAVLVLSAHYGVTGLIAAVATSIVALTLASVVVGEPLDWLAARAGDSSEILAFIGAVTVAWVVGGHVQSKRGLSTTVATRTALAAEAQAAFGELQHVADALARRADQAQLSVSYLRSIAERIDLAEPVTSADAAIELALGRIGARVGTIFIHDGSNLRLFAHRGVWSADRLLPPDLFHDRTAEQAFALAATTTSAKLHDIGEVDSDVAVPITGRDGKLLGVLAVRGLTFDLQSATVQRHDQTIQELTAIARWVSRSIGALERGPTQRPQTDYSFLFRAGERRDVVMASNFETRESANVA